jgi:hypothetical protein
MVLEATNWFASQPDKILLTLATAKALDLKYILFDTFWNVTVFFIYSTQIIELRLDFELFIFLHKIKIIFVLLYCLFFFS